MRRKAIFQKRQLNQRIDCLYKVLSINFDNKDISKFVRWHVTESCHTVVNMNLQTMNFQD